MTSDPFKIDGPTCISFSGGRTSAYMLWRVLQSHGGKLPRDAAVIFANTGKEDAATLRFVEDCKWKWDVNITWVEFSSDPRGDGVLTTDFGNAAREGEPYEALITKKSYLPNPVARFCTSDLKIKPIESYLRRTWGEFDMMVGIRADESRRLVKMRHLSTPLATAGVTRQDVLAFWAKHPFDLALPTNDGLTPLGNCDLCFLKGPNQIKSLIRDKPGRAIWWAKQEERIGGTFRSDRPSYAAMRANAIDQQEMFANDEEAIACFCGD